MLTQINDECFNTPFDSLVLHCHSEKELCATLSHFVLVQTVCQNGLKLSFPGCDLYRAGTYSFKHHFFSCTVLAYSHPMAVHYINAMLTSNNVLIFSILKKMDRDVKSTSNTHLYSPLSFHYQFSLANDNALWYQKNGYLKVLNFFK